MPTARSMNAVTERPRYISPPFLVQRGSIIRGGRRIFETQPVISARSQSRARSVALIHRVDGRVTAHQRADGRPVGHSEGYTARVQRSLAIESTCRRKICSVSNGSRPAKRRRRLRLSRHPRGDDMYAGELGPEEESRLIGCLVWRQSPPRALVTGRPAWQNRDALTRIGVSGACEHTSSGVPSCDGRFWEPARGPHPLVAPSFVGLFLLAPSEIALSNGKLPPFILSGNRESKIQVYI
ncbi:hypothetical protein HPB51_002415 [Rhipicephalus microplus]|uniref:Uncharacterized protein n=1 Tax=Rhipicephalus microplus TaxID=6941 RepID=A0A9J6DSN1_RHIMP|nr:hypothetical protein HPB51_002415 [Rhipicephalus microplus]